MSKKEEKRKAVAVKYDSDVPDDAPKAPQVVAKGYNEIADRIVEIAEESDVTVYKDRDLVEVLMKVELGEEIPEDLYETVAEILSFVYRMNKKFTI